MNVDELMTADPHTIEADQPVADAIELMESLHIRHLPVVSKGELVGVISDRDLKTHAPPDDFAMDNLGTTMDLMDRSVASLMATEIRSVAPGDTLLTAIDRLLEWRIGSLCVVDEGKLVGIVSQLDVLRAVRPIVEEHVWPTEGDEDDG